MIRYYLIGVLLLSCMAIATPGDTPPGSSDSQKTDAGSRPDSLKADKGSRIRRPPEISMFPMQAGDSRMQFMPAQPSMAGKEVADDPLVDLSLFGYKQRTDDPVSSETAGLRTDPNDNPKKRPKYYVEQPHSPPRLPEESIPEGLKNMDDHQKLIYNLDRYHFRLLSADANLQGKDLNYLRTLENRVARHHQRTDNFLRILRGPRFMGSEPANNRQPPTHQSIVANIRQPPPHQAIPANIRQPRPLQSIPANIRQLPPNPTIPENIRQPFPDPPIEVLKLRSELDKLHMRNNKMVDTLTYFRFQDEYGQAKAYGEKLLDM
ncbi:uncharacterized protein UTRI_04868_B [Ustilago trichophora]|uniref:Uncharacterized protein n=1 Tax=Ustilago trichophora TaxID=86804 RepID=A0A5C3EIH0_9BASI|nr:uncharacterized protein UTRI_04868_B [Ustilago trichophora]